MNSEESVTSIDNHQQASTTLAVNRKRAYTIIVMANNCLMLLFSVCKNDFKSMYTHQLHFKMSLPVVSCEIQALVQVERRCASPPPSPRI